MRKLTRSTLTASLAAAFFVGACASVANDPPALSSDEEVAEAEASDAEVEVSIEDRDITLSRSQVEPGPVVFHVWNNGTVNHDFELRSADGERVDREIKFTLDPDNREDVEVELSPGVYTIVCTVGDHETTGELARLRVG